MAADRPEDPVIGRYWRTVHASGAVQCLLCPHVCLLQSGEWGRCHARRNIDGSLTLPLYGFVSSLAIDPIEKKPLRRFLPGSRTFSVGFWHCTMQCPFCQNWEIAHPVSIIEEYLSPASLIAMALESGCPSISFTYSEPTLHIEYVMEAMTIAHRRGLKTVLVTNGNILARAARDILALTDATNVDLKTSDPSLYRDLLGGELKTVQNFIRIAASLCHTEVTSLVVPGILDQPEQMTDIARFLASVSPDMPLHITWYHPAWKWYKPPVTMAQYRRIVEAARPHLHAIYAAC
ncbi:MAG: radical SAM protein [Rectinemataceae bacterium]